MSKTSKKQTFLGGAALLAMSAAIVKIIGVGFKIPIKIILGADGFGYFNSAYDIYNVLLMIATTGLPVAMSRMVSEAKSLQNDGQIRRIYDVSRRVFLLIGVVGTVFMAALCIPLSDLIGQRNAWFPILCLSPAVLLICLISVNRGFFQGQGDMWPTSASQVIEALCKLVGAVLAFAIMYIFWLNGLDTQSASDELSLAHSWAAGGAILGVTLGCGISAWYLHSEVRGTDIYASKASSATSSVRDTTKELLRIAIPITLGSAGLQLINLGDTAVYMWRLKEAAGFTQASADNIKGIYNFCQTIFNLPCAFITPIVVAVIPALTEAITKRERKGKQAIMDSAMRVMSLIAMPCAVGLAILSGPIYALLSPGNTSAEEIAAATPLLALLGIAVIFNSVVLVTNGIMQSHGDVSIPVIHMLIGGVLKLIVSFCLVGIPEINLTGAAISTVVCYALISSLNLFAMARKGYTVNVLRTMFKPLLAALLMGGVAYLAETLLRGAGMPNLIVTGASIAAAGIVYIILVLALRTITKEDCTLLPKGDKIAKILKIR